MDNVVRYFEDRDIHIYDAPITETARKLIKDKPKNWEAKIFREVFRAQRKYLQSLWEIDPDSELATYVESIESEECLIDYHRNVLKKIQALVENLEPRDRQLIEAYFQVDDENEMVEVARKFFCEYIYLLEMHYDVASLDLPDAGVGLKERLQEIISVVLNESCNAFLNQIDHINDSFAEGKDVEFSINITCSSGDLSESVIYEMMGRIVSCGVYNKVKRKFVHQR